MRHMFTSILAIAIAGLLLSCNNEADDKNDDSSNNLPDSSAAANTTATETKVPTVPFEVLFIYHTVKDYDAWRAAFDGDAAARVGSGLNTIAVERGVENPNEIKIVLTAADLEKAKSFAADPRLKDVMDSAGVVSKPDIQYFKVVRHIPENVTPGSTRLQIVHKVKDYDEWVKVFDAEGPATREANGFKEFAIARGIDDPNLVHIGFEVTDMEKTKARLADPALKKIMTDAGVMGAPSIAFYKDVTK